VIVQLYFMAGRTGPKDNLALVAVVMKPKVELGLARALSAFDNICASDSVLTW